MLVATLFTKTFQGEIPGEIVYQNDHVFVLRDINPQAPVHLLIIPKSEIAGLASLPDSGDHEHILNAARVLGEMFGLTDGYRLVINQGEAAGQSVPHLHAHLIGGRPLGWPPG